MRRSTDAIFVGREDDLQKLLTFARNAFAGAAGVAFVTGEAGIGKTTLAEELFRRLQAEYGDVVTAVGRCTADSVSYLPFRALLENLLPCETQACPDTAARQITDATRSIIRDVGVDLASVFGLTLSEAPETAETVRLQQRIGELQQHWDLLSQKLPRLRREKTLVTQSAEEFRLEQTIADAEAERNQVKQQLRDLEAQIPQNAGKKSEMTVIPKDLQPAQIFGWYTKVMQNLAQHFPLALFIDDLQWADQSSLNLLLHLGRETQTDRILVIGTYRPHEVSPDSLLMQVKTKLVRYSAQEFSLDVSAAQPAAVQKAAQFVHDYLLTKYGTNFSAQLEALLVKRTEGNALFLTEILKNLEEKGQIAPHPLDLTPGPSPKERGDALPFGEGWRGVSWQLTAAIDRLEDLPEKVENVISERVDRLKKRLREILDYASVEGDDFSAQVIARSKQVEEARLLDDLTDKLMKIYQLIWERGDKALPNSDRVDEFAFKHNLIREYVYARLPKSKKRRIHAEIGECLERLYEPNPAEIAAKLAIHFYHGHVPDKAVRYCLKAAQDANQRYGAAEAVRFAKMGLEAVEERKNAQDYTENKVRFFLELAKAERRGGDPQEQKDHIQAGINCLEENFSLLDSVTDKFRAEVYRRLGGLYDGKGSQWQKEKAYLEKALSIYEVQNDQRNVVDILYLLTGSDISGGAGISEEECIEMLKRSLFIAKPLQDAKLQAKLLERLAHYVGRRNFPEAEQYAIQAIELLNQSTRSETPYDVLKLKAGICSGYAKYKTRIQYLQEILEFAKRRGDAVTESYMLNQLGEGYSGYVNLQKKAYAVFEKGFLIREQIGLRKYAMLSGMGRCFLRQGKWNQAEEYFQKSLKEFGKFDQSSLSIAQLRMSQENYVEAGKEFFRIFEKTKQFLNIMTCAKVALNYAFLKNTTQSQEYLNMALKVLQNISPADKAMGLYLIAEVDRILKEFESAKTLCQQSLDWFLTNAEDPEDLIDVAEARLVMGKILVDMQNYQEALQYLDKARNAFAICGHYALGETLLYMGKAYQGLGSFFFPQARELVTKAIAEFQRVELQHKEREAQEMLGRLL